MNATTMTATPIEIAPGHTARIYWKESKYELLKQLRLPVYSLSVIGFPLMFYTLFGLLLYPRDAAVGGTMLPAYLIASYGTFGVMGASLFGTAAGLASERGLGWLELKRASPMPPAAYFLGKMVMSATFSAVILLLLMLLGALFGGVHLGFWIGLKMLATLVVGSLPFGAMGLAIGYFAGPNSAASVVNLIYLPLSFCSGLWMPYMFLPKFIRQLAHVLPSYHLSQLGLSVIGAGQHEPVATHWEYMLVFTLICLGAARIGFRRDQGKTYG
jgi:ABC-2 type transport system permease protein